MRIRRRRFLAPAAVTAAVERRLATCRRAGEPVDVVTFVPDGEPTLDAGLGEEIRATRSLGVPVAVITNGSLLARPDVRAEIGGADVVSVKVDAADEATWHAVNRPHGGLRLEAVREGVRRFAEEYDGRLLTETMLVAGFNDGERSVRAVADEIERLAPERAWLAVPMRPPTVRTVRPPREAAVVRAHEIFQERVERVGLLVEEPVGRFGSDEEPESGLLSILAVHPMREEAVTRYLRESEGAPDALERLVEEGRIVRVRHAGAPYVCLAIHDRS
jgi:wyosine [tRNA(Phe)-imidazoG37] synthetase (radical SAM superfamily)